MADINTKSIPRADFPEQVGISCGTNLNDGPCNCQKELDPRFAALKQLLEK